MYDTNNRYVRLYHTAGATRAVFDVIAIGLPRPPPDVILNGWHQPNNPYTGDTVRIYGNALTAYGAEKVVMTSYYRVGTSGVWTALAMQTDEGVNFATTASLGPYPTGTVVQYYIACRFSGTGSEINSPRYYPTGGPTNPAAFVIPRNPPGRVWINEINYMNMLDWDDDTNEFVEVCGPAGFDLGGWRIEFYMTGADTNTYTYYASYILPKLSILSNQVNGFGFFVLGDPSAILANVNLTLTNIIYAWDPYNQISDGVYPSGIRLINEAGGFEQSISYRGPIQGFNQISASEYWQNADPKDVQMTGTGSYYTNFTWITNVTYTPGAVNVGQTLVKPADPETPPIVDIIQTVFGTNIWITTYGNTNSWIVAPYAATNLNRSQTWLAVSPFNSVYKGGGTNLLWFNIPSTGANYYYRILITKPGS